MQYDKKRGLLDEETSTKNLFQSVFLCTIIFLTQKARHR